jgi:4-aminobutyrate aminotransferase-like enzyme
MSLCPNPNLILGIPAQSLATDKNDADQIIRARETGINPSLSLSYREPIVMARGSMQYLYDTSGHRYLDAVNNVPHVGHCHPGVVAAGVEQIGILNTNTRYLYDKLTRYSEKLLQKFPAELSVCYFTNSGSEANDLALRLARNFTARHDVVILDHAYHGNLSSLIDISPYKHDANGGSGRPDHVHKACMPDTYRGEIKADATSPGESYSQSVNAALQAASARGGAAAFICETLLGCGGQIVLPPNYLNSAYAHARTAGALCIADEVQVGFGRVGSHFWGFETQQVVPDIVTLGKPIGNGHPLAAVITRREIADSFNNGMEYFNTFGGNPVSCAIGLAVLEVIEAEQLQANAREVGNYLLDGLHRLQERFEIIGDVRGLGLFIGVELVRDRVSLMPAASQASYIAERMKQNGVLISTDGPLHNVLKIKPPMCFDQDNAGFLLERLESVMEENFAQIDRPSPNN